MGSQVREAGNLVLAVVLDIREMSVAEVRASLMDFGSYATCVVVG